MIDPQPIRALLEKYWAAETTIEEDRQLKNFFASNDIPEDLQLYSPFFQALREEQQVRMLRAAVEYRPYRIFLTAAASIILLLAVGIGWKMTFPAKTTAISLQPVGQVPAQVAIEQELQSGLILAQVSTEEKKYPEKTGGKMRKKTAAKLEAQYAMEEIKAALSLVSSKIKKGRLAAAKGADHLENIDRVFKKKATG
jgi:hypothetical protein